MLYKRSSLMIIHRVGHTYCGFFPFLSRVNQFLFTKKYFLWPSMYAYVCVRSIQLFHIPLFVKLFSHWRRGYFPICCLFTLPAPITNLHTNILHHPVLSVLLHLSPISFCTWLHWSQVALNKNEKWGKSVPANRLASLVSRAFR